MELNSQDIFYCIGDSHVSFFSGQDKIVPLWPNSLNYKKLDKIKFFKTFRLGAVLANSLARYGTRMKGRELLFSLLDRQIPLESRSIPPSCNLILSFGEIDCRAHILKNAEKHNLSYKIATHRVVESYFNVIRELSDLGYKLYVWNVIPSSYINNNPEYPIYGSMQMRNKVTICFNMHLKKLCTEHGFNFIDIFRHLIDANNNTNPKYLMDGIHLSQKAMPLVLSELKLTDKNFRIKQPIRNLIDRLKFFL